MPRARRSRRPSPSRSSSLGLVLVGCRDRLDARRCRRRPRRRPRRRRPSCVGVLRAEDAAEYDRREHGEHEHARRDEERLAAQPHRDLAPGDEPDAVDEARGVRSAGSGGSARPACGRCVRAHRTTSLKIWASVVCSRVKLTTSPRADRLGEHGLPRGIRLGLEDGPAAVELDDADRRVPAAASRRRPS